MEEVYEFVKSRDNKTQIKENKQIISYEKFIELLMISQQFRHAFNNYIESTEFRAVYWECRPVNIKNVLNSFEFVILDANYLANAAPDCKAFSTFYTDEGAVSFPNLGKNAQLIVPCPLHENMATYTHLANFVRNAPDSQIHSFWKLVGEEMQKAIGVEDKWLSTAGLGVLWLHVRIDERPKYYKSSFYKN